MDEELARDEKVFIVGRTLGCAAASFAHGRAVQKYGAARVIDSPLASFPSPGWGWRGAVWLAPVCEIQFADFIYPAMTRSSAKPPRCVPLQRRMDRPNRSSGALRRSIGGGVPLASGEAFLPRAGVKSRESSTLTTPKGLLKARAMRDPNPVSSLSQERYRLIRGEVQEGIHHADRAANVSRRGGLRSSLWHDHYTRCKQREMASKESKRRWWTANARPGGSKDDPES